MEYEAHHRWTDPIQSDAALASAFKSSDNRIANVWSIRLQDMLADNACTVPNTQSEKT